MYILHKIFLSTIIILSILGCQDSIQKPKLMEQENSKKSYVNTILESSLKPKISNDKRFEFETKKEIAKIEMQKAIEIEKLRTEALKEKTLSEKEISLKKIELQKSKIDNLKRFDNWIILITIFAFITTVWLIYKLFKYQQTTKLKIHREKIEAKKELQEKELQVRVVEKMIDAISEGKLSEEQQKYILEVLNKSDKILPYK